MNLTLLDLEARQSALMSQILSLRWLKHRGEASREELRELRRLEREFDENAAKLRWMKKRKRWK